MTRPPWIAPEPEEVLPLFAAARAPAQRHSETSRAAAESLDAETLNALQRRVYDLLGAEPAGLTDEEIGDRLGLGGNTARPRRIELARRGLVVKVGTRKTRSGRSADVWRRVIGR
jgi:predicted ArsR family transcriptional regulator